MRIEKARLYFYRSRKVLPALKNKVPGVDKLEPAPKVMLPIPGETASPVLFHPATRE